MEEEFDKIVMNALLDLHVDNNDYGDKGLCYGTRVITLELQGLVAASLNRLLAQGKVVQSGHMWSAAKDT